MNPRLVILLALLAASVRAPAADTKLAIRPAPAIPAAASPATPATASPSGAATVTAGSRNDSSVAPSAAFDTFRVISDRNIFNPNRTGRRDRSTEEAPPRLDVISLVGTMDSDKGLRAFFDGSDASYRKALRVGESIDKFKLTQIAANAIELERDGKSLSVRVGQQLRRPEGSEWNVVGEDLVRREATARAAAETGRIDPVAPAAIPSNASETLRKLMEARNKQLKQ
jgi:hypothetical protein